MPTKLPTDCPLSEVRNCGQQGCGLATAVTLTRLGIDELIQAARRTCDRDVALRALTLVANHNQTAIRQIAQIISERFAVRITIAQVEAIADA